ncbi:fluoride efflux transporter FluC [Streptomyces wuyuanensis]|uniref:Fluoride-specific ion channel n=1 Tax=Streptomyces wuyuanensis TaxID=1196353 RepID=A0A1G9U9Q9_9ACTN|nr:CrcB protein [Streptomyces wuyuanensis]
MDRGIQLRRDSVFPCGTFVVNATRQLRPRRAGLRLGRVGHRRAARHGLCGALTTYSTFSYETLRLAERGRLFLASANVAGAVLV